MIERLIVGTSRPKQDFPRPPWKREELIRRGAKQFRELKAKEPENPATLRHYVDVDLREHGHKLLTAREATALSVADVLPAMKPGALRRELAALGVDDDETPRAGIITNSVRTWEELEDSDRDEFPGGLAGWINSSLRGAELDELSPDERKALDHSGVEAIVEVFGE